jgi:hypothetical protein
LTVTQVESLAKPGDTIRFLPGQYGPLRFSKSGQPGAPIIYDGSNRGAEVAGDSAVQPDCILSRGNSHIQIVGFNVQRCPRSGIVCAGSIDRARDCRIADNYVAWTGESGIVMAGEWPFNVKPSDGGEDWLCDFIVENNEITRTNEPSGRNEIISVGNGLCNGEIRFNEPHHSRMYGIDVKSSVKDVKVHHNKIHHNARCIYIDALSYYARNIEVYANECWDNSEGIFIQQENWRQWAQSELRNISIHDNIIYRTGLDCILSAGFRKSHPDEVADGLKIINNTCYISGTGTSRPSTGIRVSRDNWTNVEVRNNVVWRHRGAGSFFIPGVSLSNNLFDTVDPQWTDPDNGDFTFPTSSPLFNAGTMTGATVKDFANRERPKCGAPDIGALERQAC